MTDEEILRKAEALRELERVKNAFTAQSGQIKYDSTSKSQSHPEIEYINDWGHCHWICSLANSVFRPLLGKGLAEYKLRLREIIDE